MLPGLFPSVDQHDDWKSFARALLASLEDIVSQASGTDNVNYVVTTTVINPSQLPPLPTGWVPLWFNTADATAYLANPQYDPPTAPNIVFIDTQNIADAAVELNKLAANSVDTSKLLDGVVTTLELADDAVSAAKIQTDAVGSLEIASSAVINSKIAALAISTGQVQDAAITTAKIQNLAVTQALIGNAAVGTAQIADLAVSTAKIQLLAVGSAQIADLAVVNAKIGNAAVLTANIGDLQVLNAKIGDATILNGKIVDGTILNAKIGDLTLLRGKIADAEIVEAKIGALAVNEAKIANAAVTSAKIANLAVGAAHIQLGVIGTALITDGAITNAKIGNVIQSASWNETTKQGWHIDKAGNIRGSGIGIYDTAGNLVFSSGGVTAMGIKPGGVNYAADPAFRNGAPTHGNVPDGGGTVFHYSASGGLVGGKEHFGQIGSHSFYYDSKPFVAISDKAVVSAYTKDAGVSNTTASGGWAGGGSPTRCGKLFLWLYDTVTGTLHDGYPAFFTQTGIEPAFGGTVWERYSVSLVGLVPGRTYYPMVSVEPWAGEQAIAISALQVEDGNVATAFTEVQPAATVGAQIGANLTGQFNAVNISTFMAASTLGGTLIQDLAIGATKLADASIVFGGSKVSGFGSFAGISQITSGNISTYIASAAISEAYILDGTIINAKIADATILGAKIADATIASAKIISLDAAKVNAASLSAITATVGLLRTATSGARLEIESNQIRVYDSSNVLRVRVGSW